MFIHRTLTSHRCAVKYYESARNASSFHTNIDIMTTKRNMAMGRIGVNTLTPWKPTYATNFRLLSSSSGGDGESDFDMSIQNMAFGSLNDSYTFKRKHISLHKKAGDDYGPRRVWKAAEEDIYGREDESGNIANDKKRGKDMFWTQSVDDTDLGSMRDVLDRIGIQERLGGRMRQRKLGVLSEDPREDMRLLIENYTVPALASALRDREDVLQHCATLLAENSIDELRSMLKPYEKDYVKLRRREELPLDLSERGFDNASLEMMRKVLNRMPRRVSQAHQKRAGVVLPLCNVNNVPCILFQKRSKNLRAHPDEVCLPGGMVSTAKEGADRSIVETCLREMQEEIDGLNEDATTVLGVLRCNWGEVHHLVGVAVTPVVCYIGDLDHIHLEPNPQEVAECFTVPLSLFLDNDKWVHRQGIAPIFSGGPYMIWGLTGYIVNRFVKDVLARFHVQLP